VCGEMQDDVWGEERNGGDAKGSNLLRGTQG
jgi:hypothetical protein